MIILGLTGSIAMGKSTAAAMFRHLGIPVHDADAAVHACYKNDRDFLQQVAAYFPETDNRRTTSINRGKLAEMIFSDPQKKALLENLLHPRVHISEQRFLQKHRRLKSKLVVLDIPLLFETGAETRCDAVIVVSAPPLVQKARALSRPGMTEEKFAQIRQAQMSDAEKRARADFVIPTGLGRARMLKEIKDAVTGLKK